MSASDAWGRREALAALGGAAAIAASGPARAADAGPFRGRASYDAYMAAFNARDMPGFTRFYAPGVRMYLGGKMEIDGRQGIVDWYTKAWKHIQEHCEPQRIILDDTGLAAELRTTFTCIEDWPDFTAGPLMKGDRIVRIGFGHYDIANGYFTRVATALHRNLEVPAHWQTGEKA